MSRSEAVDNSRIFYTVIDGSFRTKVPQNHPEAIPREVENKETKEKYFKYEKHWKAVFGMVEDVRLVDGDYGKQIQITLDKNEEGKSPILSFGTDSYYGEDILLKLPNLQKGIEYRFYPYAFDEENGKKGVSIAARGDTDQFDVKVTSYFWDGEKAINGLPQPTEKDQKNWKLFFMNRNAWLIDFTETYLKGNWGTATPQNRTTGKIEAKKPIESDPSKDIDDAFDAAFEARNAPTDEERPF